MKKQFRLLAALSLLLALAACGSGDAPNSERDDASSAGAFSSVSSSSSGEEPEAPEETVLELNQTVTVGDFEMTVTGFDFTDKALSPDENGSDLVPKNGYVSANVYFNTKYNGKTAISAPYVGAVVNYNDGYTFSPENQWYYDHGLNAWLNGGQIDPLTPAFDCVYSFFVPLEVRDQVDAPLQVTFALDDEILVYHVRPAAEA
ncbi:MAG: hypothetical protein Q3Y08_07860 [Butyricicoccus sp.]|nr:hypothetical protein [Butyricicoccus sp.]